MKKESLCVLFFLLFLYACGQSKKVPINKCEIYKKDSIRLGLFVGNHFLPSMRSSLAYLKDGYFAQLTKNNILLYTLQGKLVDSIRVKVPPYEFYTWFASDIHHFYFFDEARNTFTLLGKGTPPRTWSFNSLPKTFTDSFLILGNPPEVIQDTLFAFYLPKKFEQANIYYKTSGDISLKLLDSTMHIIKKIEPFPSIYTQKKGYFSDIAFRVINQSNIVYSFNHNDSLFVYDRNTTTTKSYPIKSKFFTLPPPKDEQNKTAFYRSQYATENSSYWRLHYDPFQKCYYRIVLHAEKYTNVDGTVNSAHQKPWSLQVISTEFKLLQEITFPGKKYDFNSLWVTPKGICVALFKPSSGYVTYEVFVIK